MPSYDNVRVSRPVPQQIWVNVHACRCGNGLIQNCGKHLVDERHLVRLIRCVRQDETKRVTSETRREKVFKENKQGCSMIGI